MSTVQLRRLPRLAAPKMPGGEVHLEPPPEVPRVIPGNIMKKTLPVVMIVAVLGMVAYVFLAPGPDKSNPLFLMFPIMMVLSTVGMFAGGRGAGQAKAEMNEDRKDYLRYLGQMRERARETAQEQRAAMEWSHPDPAALWSAEYPCAQRPVLEGVARGRSGARISAATWDDRFTLRVRYRCPAAR